MLDQQEIYNTLVLSRIGFYSLSGFLELYRKIGNATEIMHYSNDIRQLIPDANQRLVDMFKNTDEIKKRVDDEIKWDEHYGVQILCMNDERYPERLRQCDDAPLALFYRGSANLNQQHVVSIVGTRHCTSYGQDIIRHFMSDLRQMCPEVLIVSGLAYGVDINAHRQALQNGYETVGVLAHGLDNLYPSAHLPEGAIASLEQEVDAIMKMLPEKQGFILPSGTQAAAQAHVCRTVCRRAERRIVELAATAKTSPEVLQYVNRLSDYLFVLSKKLNFMAGCSEKIWKNACE